MTTTEMPETHFAKSGDVSIAYQVVGDGSVDLVRVPPTISHVEFANEIPGRVELMNRYASFARVVNFDKRGQGLSDRIIGAPTLEERVDDVRAVMDTVGMQRAAVLGSSEGALMAAFFAAAHPERVSHLILDSGMAKFGRSDDYPFGASKEFLHAAFDRWGDGFYITSVVMPGEQVSPELLALAARFERLSCSPGNFRSVVEMNLALDIRHILPLIRVPTLVLHWKNDRAFPVENGRYLAEHIPGAKYIESENGTHGNISDLYIEEIEEFITGIRAEHQSPSHRILATVLFTDIVDSTAVAAQLGDTEWRRKLDEHDRIARRLVEQQRGRFIKSTGDGILAIFDGPGRAIRCAMAMDAALARLQISVRAGLHTGEVEERGGDIGGIAVHAASRVMSMAGAGEVLVSRVVTDLVAGSGISFKERGEVELKGLPGSWRLLAVSA